MHYDRVGALSPARHMHGTEFAPVFSEEPFVGAKPPPCKAVRFRQFASIRAPSLSTSRLSNNSIRQHNSGNNMPYSIAAGVHVSSS